MMNYKLQDLIDIQQFQDLQDRLNRIYCFPSAIIDNDGVVLTSTAWQEVCVNFHRNHKDASKACIKSDQYIRDRIHEANPALSYHCPHGLVDNAIPIIIDGVHYGNFFTGQFFLKEPDLSFLHAQAAKYGFDKEAYLNAVKKVPIWSQEELDHYLFAIKGLIDVIADSGLKKLREVEARKQIQKSEERYRSIIKAIMDGYWLTDTRGRLLEVNDAYCTMTGYREEELLNMQISDLEAVETDELIRAHIRTVISEGSDRFESRHRRKDGTVFDVEVSIQFRSEAGGQCVCFLRDITDQKKAVDQIRKANENMTLAADAAQFGIWDLDILNNRLEWDDWMFRLYGIDRDDFSGVYEAWQDRVHPEDRDRSRNEVEKALSGETEFDTEFRIVHPNGRIRHLKAHANVTYDESGDPVQMTGVNYDITDQKRSEIELRKSERKYRDLVNTLPYGIEEVDLNGRMVFLNDAYHRILGYASDELVGTHIWDHDPDPESEERLKEYFDYIVNERPIPEPYISKNVRKDGQIIEVNVDWSYKYNDAGELHGFIAVVTDITEKIKSEKALIESEFRFRSFVENANDIIYALTQDGHFTYVSPNWLEFIGEPAEEAIGKHFKHYVHPDDVSLCESFLNKVFSSGRKQSSVQYRIKPKTGSLRWQVSNGSPMQDEDGEIIAYIGIARDITDQKEAEEQLKRSEERYRTLFINSPLGIFRSTFDGAFLEVNPALAEMLGYDCPEDVLENVHSIAEQIYVRTENRDEIISHQIDSDKISHHLNRYRRKDGSEFIANLYLKTIFDPQNNPLNLEGIVEDITERRLAEENLKVEQKRFESLLELFPGYICLQSSDYSIRYTNHHFNTEFGQPDNRLCYEVLRGQKKPCDDCPTFKVFETQEPIIWEWESAPNGKIYLVYDFPFIDNDGSALVLEFGMDITERKKIEKRLEESEILNRLTLSNIHDTVILTDDDGNFVFICPNVQFITGYSEDEIMEMGNIRQLIGDMKFSQSMLQSEGNIQNIEAELLSKGGDTHNVLIGVKSITYRSASRLYTIHDITELKKIQKQLDQAQRIEAIGNLAGGIAHDFNNILFPIVGLSDLLLEDLPKKSLEYENALEIYKAGNRAKDLVNQILSFSRQTEHEMMPVIFQRLLKEVLTLCRATIPANIEIEQTIQDDCRPIWADPTQLHQIGMNLITNAYHAVLDKNGKIHVSLREVFMDEEKSFSFSFGSGEYACLSVSDNGIGMPEEMQKKIFEPYFTTKEKGKGTGLGLAVVYGIVKEFGGDINVRSEEGFGATFDVYLPIIKTIADELPPSTESRSQTGHEHILLVDDELSIIRLIQLTLERLGYTVTARSSSVEAIEVFKDTPEMFDMVISDMAMPDITGDQLAHEVKQTRPEIPIIICSGFSERINKDKAKEIGVSAFLMKPIVKSELAVMIRKILDEANNVCDKDVRS